jgi:hypothetical protein
MKTPQPTMAAIAVLLLTLVLAGCSGVDVAWDPRGAEADAGGTGSRYEEWTPEGFRNPR